MGIILLLITLFAAICLLILAADDKESAKVCAIVLSFVMAIILAVIFSISYDSYLSTRTFYSATVEQYRGAVTMYKDAAALDIKKAAFTDFVYKDYQNNVAYMIRDLRNKVIRYNKELISKRIMDKSFMFNWLIIAPDKDMKIIRMVEKEQKEE
ncbi:hypothetical protein LCGC14_1345350 [marine sediment metagenome]|uniref:Uncharacterized protein n=1 Tax=marine sediment metagenome TaxID=412755 RepID=A0A0F9NEW2_9ZZZZ